LIQQTNITLNLLRPCCINPKLSAHEAIDGIFNYNATPLAPPGTKVIIYESPAQRKSWTAHGIDGWYIGPATEHYQCYRDYVTKTKTERITNTVTFQPHLFPTPHLSPNKQAIQAAQSLNQALKNTHNTPLFQTPQTETILALEWLANIFQHSIHKDKARPN